MHSNNKLIGGSMPLKIEVGNSLESEQKKTQRNYDMSKFTLSFQDESLEEEYNCQWMKNKKLIHFLAECAILVNNISTDVFQFSKHGVLTNVSYLRHG